MVSLDELPAVGAPAARALVTAGYTRLRDLAGVSRSELEGLHGVGPKAVRVIQAALGDHGLVID